MLRVSFCHLARASVRIAARGMTTVVQKEKTFQYQESLPSLPVPPLEQTCRKYLESVKPFLTDEEYLQTDFLVNEFKSGLGKDLQKILLERGKTKRNWLEQWWEEEAYLRPRYPISPLVNIGGPLQVPLDIWPVEEGSQVKRAALFVHEILKIWQLIYKQELPVQKMKDKPLCMNQFAHFFSFCRVPGKEIDELRPHFQTAPLPSPRHIVVQTKGRIFYCTVLDENYEPYTAPEIERNLNQIVEIVSNKPYGPAIGSLTGDDRTSWYHLRERLVNLHANNKKYLSDIEKSLFVLVLDDHDVKTEHDVSFHAIAGDCRNRWFDKSHSFLSFPSGTFATHCDHVPFEGVVDIDIIKMAAESVASKQGDWKGRKDIINTTKPYELDFVVDNEITKGVERAIANYEKLTSNIAFRKCSFDEYGKGFPKSQKIHPDTFCQVVIQLTYYRIHKKPAPTYETAQTRQFYHGRTDTQRSCTNEAVTFCKAMLDPNEDENVKAQLFRQACSRHSELMTEAVNGQAIDRHFLGLGVIARDEGYPTPQIFLDKAWTKSGGGGNYVLSTSCVGFTPYYGLVVPMVHDGYGVFYNIQDTRFCVLISVWKDSKVTDLDRFYQELRTSFQDVRRMLLSSKL